MLNPRLVDTPRWITLLNHLVHVNTFFGDKPGSPLTDWAKQLLLERIAHTLTRLTNNPYIYRTIIPLTLPIFMIDTSEMCSFLKHATGCLANLIGGS